MFRRFHRASSCGMVADAVTFDVILLLAAFHDGRGTDVRAVRVLVELAAGSPLPQQVPALTEFDLSLSEARLVVIRQIIPSVEALLLVHQTVKSVPELIRPMCAASWVTSRKANVRLYPSSIVTRRSGGQRERASAE